MALLLMLPPEQPREGDMQVQEEGKLSLLGQMLAWKGAGPGFQPVPVSPVTCRLLHCTALHPFYLVIMTDKCQGSASASKRMLEMGLDNAELVVR